MKTIKKWLEELPEPYKEQALVNMNPAVSVVKRSNICRALGAAFDWQKSPQGFVYWNDLQTNLN